MSDHAGGFPVAGQHDFRGTRAPGRQLGRAPDPATVRRRARLDGNQELKSDREEVEKMEGMLWRARAMVVQVAKQLAVKVRERLERSRGRSGPERGWSR